MTSSNGTKVKKKTQVLTKGFIVPLKCRRHWKTFVKHCSIFQGPDQRPSCCKLTCCDSGWLHALRYINILYFMLSLTWKNIPFFKFPSKGETSMEMTAGSLPVCLAELTGFPVTARESAAFDLPGGYC